MDSRCFEEEEGLNSMKKVKLNLVSFLHTGVKVSMPDYSFCSSVRSTGEICIITVFVLAHWF